MAHKALSQNLKITGLAKNLAEHSNLTQARVFPDELLFLLSLLAMFTMGNLGDERPDYLVT